MPESYLANATDLERWADRLESRALLPALVRRLITATGQELIGLSIRASEGVQFPGWDGKVEAAGGDLHVPKGISVWEMGTNERVAQKANEDYKKRTEDPDGVDAAETIYVFVTPRRWAGKAKWAAERNAKGVWKEVRVYDADNLEHWLERARGVHAWFSATLGKDPHEAESLETWWESWSQATAPPIPPGLLLAGRTTAAEKVQTHVQRAPSAHTVAADSQEEAVAFVAAALHGNDGSAAVLGRTVIVRSPSAWRRLAVSEQPLALLPLFDGADVALALQGGHHVIVPVGREVGTEAQHELPRLRRDGIEAALKGAGLPDGKASRLATLGRRSLLSLRRTMAISRVVQTPVWSRPEHARDVLPAVLVGRWVEGHEADQMAVTKLAGRPYEEVAAKLMRWANTSDPPVRCVGDVWLVAAKQDAWTLLARHLTSDDLRRFREVAVEVLGSDDPSFELAPRERFPALISGQTRPYSSHLMAGLADTLAMMGSVSDAVPLTGERRSKDEAAVVVRELLDAANEDSSGRHWSRISDALPALAEAAPEVFLRAVKVGLQDRKPLAAVFQDHDQDMFGRSSAHMGLLWALENLAWSPQYIGPASLELAKLAAINPGGRFANRLIDSLYNIHVLWAHGTAATVDERMRALDVIRQKVPEVSWTLLLMLIPSGRGLSIPPHAPTWRDWKPDDAGGVLYVDLYRGIDAVCERVLNDVDADAERWADVVKHYNNFPPAYKIRIVKALQGLDPEALSEETRRIITDTTRGFVVRHRASPDAKRSLPPKDLDLLEASCEHLRPDDPVYRHRWLFVQGGIWDFKDRGDYRMQHEALQEAQTEAVAEVYMKSGVEGVFEWAEQLDGADGPRRLGNALGGVKLSTDDDEVVFAALESDKEALRHLASGFVARRSSLAGDDWVEWARGIVSSHPGWSPEHKAQFLAALPATPGVWNLAEVEGTEVDRSYWLLANHYGLPMRGEACARAARKLIEHGRPHTAVELLDPYAEEMPEGPTNDLVADALEASARTELLLPLGQMFAYHVGRHLDRLAEHSFDENRLATLEWMYLPVFRYDKRRSPILHSALSNNPEDFVKMVSIAYRAEGEEPRDLSESEQAMAMTAYDLLDSWCDVPGKCQDNTIDREKLFTWVNETRRLLSEAGRLRSGDLCIGRVLRYGPPPEEDAWPCEPIRELIEAVASDDLEDGLRFEIYNSRGTTIRGVTEGGAQERELVEQYRRYARSAGRAWPRTAALLELIAQYYENDARRNDLDADLTQDLWR
jgi:hypothetical protein